MSWIMQLNLLYHSIFNQNLRSALYWDLPIGWIQNLEVMVQKLFELRRGEKNVLDPL